MFKNWFVTLAGIMAGLGTLPLLVTTSHIAFPLWWNDLQFPLVLVGMVGTILLGVAAKGQDQHSIPAQIQAADAAARAQTPDDVARAKVQMKQADILAAKKS